MKSVQGTKKAIRGKDELIFDIIGFIFLGVFSIFVLYPIIYILAASLSDASSVETGAVLLFPKNLNFESYIQAAQVKNLWVSYGNAVFYTIFGTAINMVFTATAAYALSKKELPGRKIIMILLVFTMWFDPGIIAQFLNFRSFGFFNSRASIIFGFAISTYNLIILRSFFEAVPKSLEEAAMLDGANHWKTFLKVYLPLSKSALVTVGLFYGVNRWNGYFWAKILLKDEKLVPLQVLLTKLIVQKNTAGEAAPMIIGDRLASAQTIIYAIIILSIIPMLILYPLISKYFKGGVTLGAVKE